MKQGSLTAHEFMWQVLAKAQVFSLGTHSKFDQGHQNEFIAVLMNSFNDHIKTMILTWKAKTLNEVIQAAHGAKCLEEHLSTDTVLVAFQEAVARLEASADVIKKAWPNSSESTEV